MDLSDASYQAALARERQRFLAWARAGELEERAGELEEPKPLWRLDLDWLRPRFTRSGREYYEDLDGSLVVDFRQSAPASRLPQHSLESHVRSDHPVAVCHRPPPARLLAEIHDVLDPLLDCHDQ